ncbi:unnamed protein product [Caenorhabditis brenneri]
MNRELPISTWGIRDCKHYDESQPEWVREDYKSLFKKEFLVWARRHLKGLEFCSFLPVFLNRAATALKDVNKGDEHG